jgi:hypothetical protein
MAMLVYSDRCQYSQQILRKVQENPALLKVLQFHNVTTQGVPNKQVTRVPTLLTSDGKVLVGHEVKAWVESMIPVQEFETLDSFRGTTMLDESDLQTAGSMFDLDMYGASLAPMMTQELEEKINKKVQDAYSALNK